MQLTGLDWLILGAFLAVSLGIGLRVSRRAGSDFSSFFLAGRRQPWWLLGISMVATTFSTDTPNLVADIVRRDGVLGNWTWWAFLLSGMLTVFLYAKLWRRSGVSTDVEFYELRYSGRTAAFLRGFRGVYLGLAFNVLIMAAVTLAAIKIGSVMFGWSPVQTVLVAASVTLVYSALGGLQGVLLTDLIQFAMAMVGSIAATIHIVRLPQVGGLDGLLARPEVQERLAFWPSPETASWSDLAPVFLVPLLVQWWAAYYPGSEPGGGGYLVQRMLSARTENHALGATLLFNLLHYAVRPWPWILVALASLVVFPGLEDIQQRFPHVAEQVVRNDLAYPAMLTFLPPGLLGLVVASLAAAYMSTMSTSVNWGFFDLGQRRVSSLHPAHRERCAASLGRPLGDGGADGSRLRRLALDGECSGHIPNTAADRRRHRPAVLVAMVLVAHQRVDGMAAMIASFSVAMLMPHLGAGLADWEQLLVGVALTTLCWLPFAFFAPPTDERTLVDFYRRTRPGGFGWARIARLAGEDGQMRTNPMLTVPLIAAGLGSVTVYATLFAVGFWLYGQVIGAFASGLAALLGGAVLVRVWLQHSNKGAEI